MVFFFFFFLDIQNNKSEIALFSTKPSQYYIWIMTYCYDSISLKLVLKKWVAAANKPLIKR